MKPTPGPWSVSGNRQHKTVLVNIHGESIASGGNNRMVVGEELEASLRLAAAAPDLLAALRHIADGGEVQGSYREFANAAIAKAGVSE